MRRLGRILRNALTVLSLLLCVATAVLWVRSYRDGFSGDRIPAAAPGRHHWELRSQGGELALYRMEGPWFFSGPSTGGKVVPRYNSLRAFGFPHWVLATATAVAPVGSWAASRRTRRRASRGLCPSCGYDLRATPERCPECGVIPIKSKT